MIGPAGGHAARLRTLALAFFLLAAAAAFNVDLLSGSAVPVYRDLGTTQLPGRELYARLGKASLNPHASFGQPYWGNPNLALAYPFPKGRRFLGLHLLLHLAFGTAGATLFFSRFVRAPEAALFGGLSFGLSGYVVSSLAFLNATTTIAWLPWLLLATHSIRDFEGRRTAYPLLGVAVSSALLVLGGEPALAAIAVALALAVAFAAERKDRLGSVAVLCAGGLLGAAAISPWLLEVFRASAFSSRLVKGFSWSEFSAVSLHPARLLETPFPFLFGDPSRLAEGGFWGFFATRGNPPYLASLCFGVLPATLALLFVLSARRGEGRLFIAIAAAALAGSLFPSIPGARRLYEALGSLHALRYPLKALLAFALALSGLAALGADRLLVSGAVPRFRRHASWALLGVSAVIASLSVVLRLRPGVALNLFTAAWDPSWASPPQAVLGPVIERLPLQAALAATLCLFLSWLLSRGTPDGRGRVLLVSVAAAELLVAARPLLPRVPASAIDHPSPLVERAAAIPGRVFERTGKDLDPVRRGLFGTSRRSELSTIVMAQWAQGWALSASPFGLRYAYDMDPDGSYSFLTRVATDVVVSRGWPGRLKWLRASGVGSIIAHDVPPGLAGVAPVFVELGTGVPTTLYRLTDPLPGIRRASRVYGAASVNEAVARFERTDFDPGTDAVVAGRPPDRTSDPLPDRSAFARVLSESPDSVTVETSGSRSALLVVDRSFAPRVRALVGGVAVKVFATNVHLIGIPVPRGSTTVEVALAQ